MTPADFADLAVRGTAWLAMACYFLGAFLLLQTHGADSVPRAFARHAGSGRLDAISISGT